MYLDLDDLERRQMLRIEFNGFRIKEHYRICHERPLSYEGRVKAIISGFKELEEHGSSPIVLRQACDYILNLVNFLREWNAEDIQLQAFVMDRSHKYKNNHQEDMTL